MKRLLAMTNFNNTSLCSVDCDEDVRNYGDMYNNTRTSSNNYSVDPKVIVFHIILCVSIIGLVGNGTVIYLLGFQIKRSPFTTYILNLAVADFGVLLFGIQNYYTVVPYAALFIIFLESLTLMYIASQLLLTAISIDRCVSVLFPIWHRCHRPPHLSTTVCTLIWVVSCLLSVSVSILYHLKLSWGIKFFYPFIIGAILCLPLVMISTLILLFKVFCKSQQAQRGRILTIVLLNLCFYLIFAFPLNAIFTVNYFSYLISEDLEIYGLSCASLNSCVNPVIYFMVGRKKRGQRRQSLKVMLQRAFQEEEEHREEWGTTAQTSL